MRLKPQKVFKPILRNTVWQHKRVLCSFTATESVSQTFNYIKSHSADQRHRMSQYVLDSEAWMYLIWCMYTRRTYARGFNAAVNNCHPNGVSLERPPMCRVLPLWVITDLPSGPLMWEMFLISICFLVYAFPLHSNKFISFGNPLKIQSHSFQVAWNRGPSSRQHVDPHHGVLFLISARFSLLNSVFLSSPSCRRPLVHRAHILSRPRLKVLVLFYSAVVNALPCCDSDCNFLVWLFYLFFLGALRKDFNVLVLLDCNVILK